MANAKQGSRSASAQIGVSADVFDTFDELASGATTVFEGGNSGVQQLLMSKGMSLAHGLVTQMGGTQNFSAATQLAGPAIDVVLGAASTGRMPEAGQVASVIGGAAGMAICGPLCGVAGAMVGTVAVEVIGSLASGFGELFGMNTSDARKMYDRDIATTSEIIQIQQSLSKFTASVMQSVYYGVARIYNQMLGLGVPDFSPATEIYKALEPYDGNRYSYANTHNGLQPEQVDLLGKQSEFVTRVYHAANGASGGLWDRNAAESGWVEKVKAWAFDGQTPRMDHFHKGTTDRVWCTWKDAGHPECGPPEGPPLIGGLYECNPYPQGGRGLSSWFLDKWRCDNQDTQRRYRGWLKNAATAAGKKWGEIATRDCAILQLKAAIDKTKAAQLADQSGAQAAAARLKAASDYMAQVDAQKSQTKAAQSYIDEITALRAQQAKELAAREAYNAAATAYNNAVSAMAVAQAKAVYAGQVAEMQQTKVLAAQMIEVQVVSRSNILALLGKWTTQTKVLAAGGVGLVLTGVGVALYFWTRNRKPLAA